MASKSRRSVKYRRTAVRKSRKIFLTNHDEDKLLLFSSGVLLGVGLSLSLFLQQWWYGGLVALALGIVLLLIERRQQ